ncbi:MAG TPA: hypothetical protein VEZ42_19310 [Pseudonocardia sp.]|nr:hypothetical protein [Pseudonocardia sp.]
MVEQDSGDYGYDLAHEVRTAVVGPTADRARRTPVSGLRRATTTDAGDGDFGYDLAHER